MRYSAKTHIQSGTFRVLGGALGRIGVPLLETLGRAKFPWRAPPQGALRTMEISKFT